MEPITKTLNSFVKYGVLARDLYGSVISGDTSIDLEITATPPDPEIAIKYKRNGVSIINRIEFERVAGHTLYLAYHLLSDTLFVRVIDREE